MNYVFRILLLLSFSSGALAVDPPRQYTFLGVTEGLSRLAGITHQEKDGPHYDMLIFDAIVVIVVLAPFIYFGCSGGGGSYGATAEEYDRIQQVLQEMRQDTREGKAALSQSQSAFLEGHEFRAKCSALRNELNYRELICQGKVTWRVLPAFVLNGLTEAQAQKVQRLDLWNFAFNEYFRIGERAALIDEEDLDDVLKWVYIQAQAVSPDPTPTSPSTDRIAELNKDIAALNREIATASQQEEFETAARLKKERDALKERLLAMQRG